MADNDTQKNSFFNSGIFKNIANRLPYQTPNAKELLGDLNPKYDTFQDTGVRRAEALSNQSIFYSNEYNNIANAQISKEGQYAELVYANIEENKGGRMRDYRVMSAFAEIADALDEICDQTINIDDNGNIITLMFRNSDLSEENRLELQAEFEKYIDYFDLERKGFEYFRQLLVEGEVFFEHIIHKSHTKEGILGIV